MATTDYPVNHPLAQKLWAKELFHDVIGESFAGKFMGKSSDSLVQIKTETQKDAGDRIRIGLRGLLTGDGVQGDSTLEGNEEALNTYYDDLLINQLRHAVRSDGEMSEQRVPFSVRAEAKAGLKEWWIERLEISLANQLTGFTTQSDTRYTGNNATSAPTSGRFINGGSQTAESSLSATTTNAILLADLDKAVALAKTYVSGGRQRIRPVMVNGKPMYVAFLHPDQIYQMRAQTATGGLWDFLRAQVEGGKIADNPLLTGASFIYNQVIVHEWSYLPHTVDLTTDTNFRRGVLCGAQAAAIGFGQNGGPSKFNWKEELFDYQNQLGVKAGTIFGIKKTVFNSIDFGTIVLSGYAPAQA